MNGSTAAMASPCSWERRGISYVRQQHSSPTCAQKIPYFGPSAHTPLVSVLAVQLPSACGEGQPHSKWHPSAARGHYVVSVVGRVGAVAGCLWLRAQMCVLQLGVVLIMLLETGLTAASVGSGSKTKTSFKWITGSFLYYKRTYFCLSGGLELYLLSFWCLHNCLNYLLCLLKNSYLHSGTNFCS